VTVVFSDAAVADMEAIESYIAQFSPHAARGIADQILQSISVLEQFPAIGRPGQHFGTRELPIPTTNYVAIYEGSGTRVNIPRIWDARQGGRPILRTDK